MQKGEMAQIDQYIDATYLAPLQGDPANEALRSELGKVYVALKLYDAAAGTDEDSFYWVE